MRKHRWFHTIAAACLALSLAAGLPAAQAQGNTFADVTVGEWYYEAVMQASHLGIINGYPNGNFGPEDPVSRSQIVKILYNCYGKDQGVQSGFTDVPTDAWYARAVTWASQTGIVQGIGNKLFAPDAELTREQMVNILYAKAGRPEVDANTTLAVYIDLKEVSSWAKDAMAWAVSSGIITGTSAQTLSPRGITSRAQAAAIVTRYLATIDHIVLPVIEF